MTTITDTEVEKISREIAKLQKSLETQFAKRAGRKYGAFGWGYCPCGRRATSSAIPDVCSLADPCTGRVAL